MAEKRKHILHKENCQTAVRKRHEVRGKTILLTGRHGFEWSVVQMMDDGHCRISTFPNRKSATKVYNNLVKLHK